MTRFRTPLLVGLAVLILGSLTATLAYACYLRSDAYRRYCADRLSRSLGLPSDIGQVVPRSRAAREFRDVSVWLPDRRDRALFCKQAILAWTPLPENPLAYTISIRGGTCEISTRTWLQEDYRNIVEAGLRPGFTPDGPQQVTFTGMDLRLARDEFHGTLEGATGIVSFEDRHTGWATAHCNVFNAYQTPEPVVLNAKFSPHNSGIRVDALTLRVPELPVRVLRLANLTGADVTSGTFTGDLHYSETRNGGRITLRGSCHDLCLAECTHGLTPQPWRGTGVEIELKELTLENGLPLRLRFGGVLKDLVLSDVLAPLGLTDVGGDAILRVRDADFSRHGIDYLVASGHCSNVSLEALTARLGHGSISGSAQLVIEDLTIEDNRLQSLDAVFRVADTPAPNWVEGRLLTSLTGRLLGIPLPALLPERIEYTQLGFRLDVRDEELYVFGSHGPGQKTIMTVRLHDREIPLLLEPRYAFDLTGWCDLLRARLAVYLEQLTGAPQCAPWDARPRRPEHPSSSPATTPAAETEQQP